MDKLLPREHRSLPSLTFGETGTGWKGVRRWCQQTWQLEDSSLEKILSSGVAVPLDLLVIHLDQITLVNMIYKRTLPASLQS